MEKKSFLFNLYFIVLSALRWFIYTEERWCMIMFINNISYNSPANLSIYVKNLVENYISQLLKQFVLSLETPKK